MGVGSHNSRRSEVTFEMSLDGGKTWEELKLPPNCTPYHQCMLLGVYREGNAQYRKANQ